MVDGFYGQIIAIFSRRLVTPNGGLVVRESPQNARTIQVEEL